MTRYIARRLLQAGLVLIGVSLLVFLVLRLSGDPAALMLPQDARPEDIARFRESLGLNDPIPVQYARFAGDAISGDFGNSLRFGTPALPIVVERLPATFQLAVVALAISVATAIPLGVIAAIKRNSLIDRLIIGLMLIGQAIPVFWLGILLILIFAVNLRLLPAFGYGNWQNLVLPALTLALYSMARIARLTRSSMIDVLQNDYVRTARAKGLTETTVVARHTLRNAALPIVTLIALEFGVLLGGAVITETIFAWPGVGRLAVQSILARDFPLVQAIVLVIAFFLVLINLLTDLCYVVLDPRIRLG